MRISNRTLMPGIAALLSVLLFTSVANAMVRRTDTRLDEDAYWDSHAAAVGMVTALTAANTATSTEFEYGQPLAVRVQLSSFINGGSWPAEMELTRAGTWYAFDGWMPGSTWQSGANPLPDLSVGKNVLIMKPTGTNVELIAAYVLQGSDPEQAPIVKACREIMKLRAMPVDMKAFEHALSSGEPLAIRYVINRFLKAAPPAEVERIIPELDKLRRNEDIEVAARLLASLTLNQLQKRDERTSDDWKWALSAIANSTKLDERQLFLLHLRLLGYPSHRAETAAFLMRMAADPKRRVDIRLSSLRAMSQGHIYTNANPSDPISEKVLATFLALLKDEIPEVRTAAGDQILQVLSSVAISNVPQPLVSGLAKRARAAVAAAIEKEPDPGVRKKLGYVLNDLPAAEPATMPKATGSGG